MTGLIPQSTALAEATPDSLDMLINFDPFGVVNNRERRAAIITELRTQRARHEAAEAAVASGASKNLRAAKASQLTLTSNKSAEDLGL